MKIEKISDNQIRCTLNKADITSRQLKISELAYGNNKAKALFRDVMQQAAYELGFEADDMPLMIEAIPVSADCIVIIVTKVDDPEELDTRFSKFTPTDSDDDDFDYPFDDTFDTLSTFSDDYKEGDYQPLSASDELELPDDEIAGDVISLFNKVKEYLNSSISQDKVNNSSNNSSNNSTGTADFIPFKDSVATKKVKPTPVIRIFSFDSFETFTDAALAVNTTYCDKNSLYKLSKTSTYYLVLYKTVCESVDFNKTCNILSEFGNRENATIARVNYFDEHLDCIIRNRAIQLASKI